MKSVLVVSCISFTLVSGFAIAQELHPIESGMFDRAPHQSPAVAGVRSDFMLRKYGVVRIYSGVTGGDPIQESDGTIIERISNNDFKVCEIAVLSFGPADWTAVSNQATAGFKLKGYDRSVDNDTGVVTIKFHVGATHGRIGPFWYTALIQGEEKKDGTKCYPKTVD